MFNKIPIAFIWAAIVLLGLAWVSPASAEKKTAVIITNGLNVKVSVRFKCYTDKSWETNTCPSTGGQALYIDSKSNFVKAYTHPPGCNNIYISFTRYDRSTPSCTVEKKFGFTPDEAKMITIQSTGPDFCDYTMDSINGTVLKR